jgi:hypothetical protein
MFMTSKIDPAEGRDSGSYLGAADELDDRVPVEEPEDRFPVEELDPDDEPEEVPEERGAGERPGLADEPGGEGRGPDEPAPDDALGSRVGRPEPLPGPKLR